MYTVGWTLWLQEGTRSVPPMYQIATSALRPQRFWEFQPSSCSSYPSSGSRRLMGLPSSSQSLWMLSSPAGCSVHSSYGGKDEAAENIAGFMGGASCRPAAPFHSYGQYTLALLPHQLQSF